MAKLPTLIVAGALLGVALPSTIATATAATREAASDKIKAATDSKGRICLREDQPETGSILARRFCKTQSQWQADGVDIAKLVAAR